MSFKVVSTKDKKVVLIANVKDASFKCIVCRKVFVSDGHLGRHYNRRHPSLNFPSNSWSSKPKAENNDLEHENQSFKAVLNATQRIECLLANLTLKKESCPNLAENGTKNDLSHQKYNFDANKTFPVIKSSSNHQPTSSPIKNGPTSPLPTTDSEDVNEVFDLPLANSTLIDINSDSFDDIASFLESRSFSEDEESSGEVAKSSARTHLSVQSNKSKYSNEKDLDGDSNKIHLVNKSKSSSIISKEKTVKEDNVLNKTFSCLDHEENEALKRIVSYVPKPLPRTILSDQVCDSRIILASRETSDKGDVSNDSSSKPSETLADTHKRLKHQVIASFNDKLRKYGVDPSWKKIPDKTAKKISSLLNAEREEIRKSVPDYNKLRELINHNANTRIEMSLHR